MTHTDATSRLREAATVLTAVDQYLANGIPALPESITDAQWDATAEIPANIRKTLAAWLEKAAHAHQATLIAAGRTWASVTDPRAVAFVEHMTDRQALAVADAILGTPQPTADLNRCPAAHGALGRICELPVGHAGMHTGADGHGHGAIWDGDAPA